MTAPALRLQGVSKHYGTVRAVDRVTLEVRPGKVYALLGLNGAGKTTVMRTVLGMVRPSAAGAATRTAGGPRPCSATPAP
ncbi:ATP-binding cassette domain-containing protein, partial [Kocuria sp. CCUG 69068]|uniref:ATP-binding cassette domain-containing protein n=1 Tax=Kocuria sp. CCUG 69068 TaxID=2043138 RepID=UPI001E2B4D0D